MSTKHWHIVRVPSTTRIKTVAKEAAAQGKIYVVSDIDSVGPYWVSQSLPALLEAMNREACKPKRLFPSSCYRILRGECAQEMHKFHQVKAFSRDEDGIQQLNKHFEKARSIVFITKTPHIWKIHGETEGGADETPVAEETPAGDGTGDEDNCYQHSERNREDKACSTEFQGDDLRCQDTCGCKRTHAANIWTLRIQLPNAGTEGCRSSSPRLQDGELRITLGRAQNDSDEKHEACGGV